MNRLIRRESERSAGPKERRRVSESREARKLASITRRTSTRNRVRSCSGTVAPGALAEVSIDEDGSATISNLMRCGSWLVCPICAAVYRSRTRAEVERAVDEWAPHGGGFLFVTVTFSHGPTDRAEDAIADYRRAVRALHKDRGYREALARIGAGHSLRMFDFTASRETGPHPHDHRVYFTAEQLGPGAAEAFRRAVAEAWDRAVRRVTDRYTVPAVAVHAAVADRGAAGYMARHSFGDLAGSKQRPGRGLSIWAVHRLADRGDGWARALVASFERGVRGMQGRAWSKLARADFDLDAETEDEARWRRRRVVGWIHPEAYRAIERADVGVEVREAFDRSVEAGAALVRAVCAAANRAPPDSPVPRPVDPFLSFVPCGPGAVHPETGEAA